MLAIYRRVICESFSLLAHQTKKLSNFEVRGRILFVGEKFFYGQPYATKFVRVLFFWVVHCKSATLTPDSKNKKNCQAIFFVFGVRRQLRWKKFLGFSSPSNMDFLYFRKKKEVPRLEPVTTSGGISTFPIIIFFETWHGYCGYL